MLTAASVMMSASAMSRHVQHKAVADATRGAKSRIALHHRAHQLVGVEATLHQRLGPPFAHKLDGLGGRSVAVRDVDTFIGRDVQLELLRDSSNFRLRTDQDGPNEPHLRRVDRSLERALVARVRDRGDHRVEAFRRRDEALVLLVLLTFCSLEKFVVCVVLTAFSYKELVPFRGEADTPLSLPPFGGLPLGHKSMNVPSMPSRVSRRLSCALNAKPVNIEEPHRGRFRDNYANGNPLQTPIH